MLKLGQKYHYSRLVVGEPATKILPHFQHKNYWLYDAQNSLKWGDPPVLLTAVAAFRVSTIPKMNELGLEIPHNQHG